MKYQRSDDTCVECEQVCTKFDFLSQRIKSWHKPTGQNKLEQNQIVYILYRDKPSPTLCSVCVTLAVHKVQVFSGYVPSRLRWGIVAHCGKVWRCSGTPRYIILGVSERNGHLVGVPLDIVHWLFAHWQHSTGEVAGLGAS